MFNDVYSEVPKKAMQVTVPSVRKENAVAVKINVTELRSRHAKFILTEIIVGLDIARTDFRDVCFQ